MAHITDLLPCFLQAGLHLLAQTVVEGLQLLLALLVVGADQFSSGRRCGCSLIGDKVGNSRVGFVADGADDGQ